MRVISQEPDREWLVRHLEQYWDAAEQRLGKSFDDFDERDEQVFLAGLDRAIDEAKARVGGLRRQPASSQPADPERSDAEQWERFFDLLRNQAGHGNRDFIKKVREELTDFRFADLEVGGRIETAAAAAYERHVKEPGTTSIAVSSADRDLSEAVVQTACEHAIMALCRQTGVEPVRGRVPEVERVMPVVVAVNEPAAREVFQTTPSDDDLVREPGRFLIAAGLLRVAGRAVALDEIRQVVVEFWLGDEHFAMVCGAVTDDVWLFVSVYPSTPDMAALRDETSSTG